MSVALALSDLNTEINHEPRVPDLRLAEALGFERARNIRKLIDRHKIDLERFGTVCSTWSKPGPAGGRPSQAFWLNKKQALYITAKSDTPIAADVTIQMVEVFDEYLRGTLVSVAPPPALAPGLMHMMVGSRIVLVDASDYGIGVGDEAVVCDHAGKVSILRGPLDPGRDSPWMGKRYAQGKWRKARKDSGASRERPGYTVMGRVIEPGGSRRRMVAGW